MKRSIGSDELTDDSLLSKQQIDSLKPLIEELTPTLNAYLSSIGDGSEKRSGIERPSNSR